MLLYSHFNCRGEHKMQLRRNTGSGSEEDPTHNGEFTVLLMVAKDERWAEDDDDDDDCTQILYYMQF